MHAQSTPTVITDTADQAVLYMALELAEKEWKVAFSDGRPKPRLVRVPGRDLTELGAQIDRARARFGLPTDCPVISCYEAGRDGFWLHRQFARDGIENVVVDPASIEVNRRRRRPKTDRIDARKLLNRLVRHHGDEPDVWSIVRVPTIEDEDARELHRELGTLKKELSQHRNRISSLLVKHGIPMDVRRDFSEQLDELRLHDGSPLPPFLEARLRREFQRLQQAQSQVSEIKAQQRQMVQEPTTKRLRKAARLYQLRGIGHVGSWDLTMEFFGWRHFNNRRQLGSAAGLTGTPYDTGDSDREQGISKAGNKRVRALMIELAWCWLRYQPQSALSQWFNERFGKGKRQRKVGIVALARRLLIDLWRFVEFGVVPERALLKAE